MDDGEAGAPAALDPYSWQPPSNILEKAKYTLISTRSNELACQKPGQLPEATIGGLKSTTLICWDYVRGKENCGCAGTKAHICHKACGGAVNAALGGEHRCRRPARCNFHHPEAAHVRAALADWWRSTHNGEEPVWSVATVENAEPAQNNACKGGKRSLASSAAHHDDDDAAEDSSSGFKQCTVPVAIQLERLRKHEGSSAHVKRFLGERFLDELLADEALRPLLSMRKCAKEISEAYGAAAKAIRLLEQQSDGTNAAGGAGCTILDVCCGKGLTGVLLSFLLPQARILLFDSNGAMDLSHLTARANVTFQQLDIFAAGAMAEIRTAIVQTEPKAVVAIGTHLCGALSPRLIDVTLRLPAIHALILSPCCLKGSLGASIARVAKEAKPEVVDGPYHLLVASLAELTRAEMRRNAASSADEVQCEPCEEGEEDGGGGFVSIEYDAEVLSPKNAFIVVDKARRCG